MKIVQKSLTALALIALLSGCGGGGSGGGDMGSLMGGGGGGGDMNSLMGGGDMNSLMGGGGGGSLGGLMGGGGLDMSMLLGDDDDGDDDSSSTNNPPPPNFEDKGDVFIKYKGQDIFFKAVASPDETIYFPAYQQNPDESYTVRIAGYNTFGNKINTQTGFLFFMFNMANYKETGGYEFIYPEHKSGQVIITVAKEMENNMLHLKGKLENAEIYSQDKNSTFLIDVDFDVDVALLPPAEQQQ